MEWADLGEELTPTRAGSSDEGLSSVFAHQIAVFAAFLVFGFVICLLSLDMASGNAWNAALIDALFVATGATAVVWVAASCRPVREWVGYVGKMQSGEQRALQRQVNNVFEKWRDGTVPARAGLMVERALTPIESAWIHERFELQRGCARQQIQDGVLLRQRLATIDAAEQSDRCEFPGLRLFHDPKTDVVTAVVTPPPSMDVDQVVEAVPALAQLWNMSADEPVVRDRAVLIRLHSQAKEEWAR